MQLEKNIQKAQTQRDKKQKQAHTDGRVGIGTGRGLLGMFGRAYILSAVCPVSDVIIITLLFIIIITNNYENNKSNNSHTHF